MGVKGLNQCQRRWWKHVSPQRALEIQNNPAPDMQMSPCLPTDGSKHNITWGAERGQAPRGCQRVTDRGQREKLKETEEGLVKQESLWGRLKAAHATKQDNREVGRYERQGKVERGE